MNIRNFTNAELATLIVAKLGGAAHPVHTEDAAIELYKYSPSRFSWKKYPERIDIHVVRVALSDAQRKSEPLLQGGIKDGWMLSPAGVAWSKTVILDPKTGSSTIGRLRKGSFLDQLEIEKKRLKNTRAVKVVTGSKSEELTIRDLYEFLRINEYFPSQKVQNRISLATNAIAGDKFLEQTWQILIEKFSEEISSYEF